MRRDQRRVDEDGPHRHQANASPLDEEVSYVVEAI